MVKFVNVRITDEGIFYIVGKLKRWREMDEEEIARFTCREIKAERKQHYLLS